MDVHPRDPEDPLASPTRRRLFQELVELRRPATTLELADRVGRHHNWVRQELSRLLAARLVERRTVRRPRGRPRHEWAVAPQAQPGGRDPEAYAQLGRWLARAVGRGEGLDGVERAGREVGRELAPADGAGSPADSLHDVLVALGFAPRLDRDGPGGLRYVLRNCPYREAVRENQLAVCTLHRGITLGLLDRLAPEAELAGFVPRDPDTAGCLIDVAGAGSRAEPR
ncbi:MAG TPA: helix-turn-helix domain-containing protein [Solirubrobacteraceae bacterium]|jgi:predicted ArsR family transcriptional regulator|nr:helix-turn-helix domain-containing protein [Solirubrobacteraceae bacterium]